MMIGRVISIKRMAVHDGDGLRTTVFLKGCPLHCLWCHNPEGISSVPQMAYYEQKCLDCGKCTAVCCANTMNNGRHLYHRDRCIGCGKCESVCLGDAFTFFGKEMTVNDLLPKLTEDRVFYEASGGGVTVSGGEPLLQVEFVEELFRKLKTLGIRTAVDTCGFVNPETFEKILPWTDDFLYDVKAFDSNVHRKLTGCPNALILENLRMLCNRKASVEIRIPVVPGLNDTELPMIAEFLRNLPLKRIRLLAYHHFAVSKYQALGMDYAVPEIVPPTEKQMTSYRALFPVGIIE